MSYCEKCGGESKWMCDECKSAMMSAKKSEITFAPYISGKAESMKITDQEILAAFHALKSAAKKDESLLVEKDRIEYRLQQIKILFEDGGEERKAQRRMHDLMVSRNMKALLVGDDVVTLVGTRVTLATGLVELEL